MCEYGKPAIRKPVQFFSFLSGNHYISYTAKTQAWRLFLPVPAAEAGSERRRSVRKGECHFLPLHCIIPGLSVHISHFCMIFAPCCAIFFHIYSTFNPEPVQDHRFRYAKFLFPFSGLYSKIGVWKMQNISEDNFYVQEFNQSGKIVGAL